MAARLSMLMETDTALPLPPERRLVRTFALRSLGAIALVGLAIHLVVSNVVGHHFDQAAEFHAEFVTTAVLEPMLRAVDADAMGTQAQADLAETIRRDALDGDVVQVTIWRGDGTLLVADAEGMLGTDVRGPAEKIARTLEGRVTSLPVEIGAPGATTDGLSTWIPVDEGPYVVEIVQDRAGTQAAAAELTRLLDLGLLVALILLWVLLLPITRRAAARLASQHSELLAQHAEVQRLLEVERAAVARLQELAELKDSFLTAISHELRTPLTVVHGSLTTLDRHGADLPAETRATLIARARAKAARLDELLQGLLDLREDTDHEHVQTLAAVDLRHLIEVVQSQLPPRDLEVALEVTSVAGDPRQIERILANLIGNAIRHTPDDTPILVRSSRTDRGVDLVVEDRGPGVPGNLKHEIFQPFRQGPIDDAHSPGTGIGLSLVARFAHLHGGRAWVEDRPGGGASFHVLLPQRDAEVIEAAGRG